MTSFWGNYLRKFDLWAEGRATHAFRHTFADRLRAKGATDEDIGAILGHRGRSITAGYGGVQPIARKAITLAKLDFGFDVVAALGGPYDHRRHGSEPDSREKRVRDAAASQVLDGVDEGGSDDGLQVV